MRISDWSSDVCSSDLACAGFIPHNFYPARLFMGDSGSMLLGLLLSASALTLSGQFSATEVTQGGGGSDASLLPTLLPIIVPLSLLIVPFADLILAVIRPNPPRQAFSHPDKTPQPPTPQEIGPPH